MQPNRRIAAITIRQQQGLTLVELMVGIAILAILVTVVLPGFGTVLQRNQMITHVNDFVLAVGLARSEAVRRGARVTVSALDASSNTNEWGPGWEVRDNLGNVIRDFGGPIDPDLTFDGPNGIAALTFNGRGVLCDVNGALCTTPAVNAVGDYVMCFDDADIGFAINVSTIGRATSRNVDGADPDDYCLP